MSLLRETAEKAGFTKGTWRIGFMNGRREDETEFSAATIDELEECWRGFAKENHCSEDIVTYVEKSWDPEYDQEEGPKMIKLSISAHPYAHTYGTICVPADLDPKKYGQYIFDHFNDVNFGEPDFDYGGTAYEIEKEDGTTYESCFGGDCETECEWDDCEDDEYRSDDFEDDRSDRM